MISIEDIQDIILKDLIQQSDIDEAVLYLQDLASSLKVNIASPLPFKARQLLIAYTCMTRAKFQSSGVSSESYGQGTGYDSYELKRRIYSQEVDRITNEIEQNPSILSGITEEIGSVSIPLSRC
ncbi:MAG: hypothetical protein ACI3ZR_05855 [bacterium]